MRNGRRRAGRAADAALIAFDGVHIVVAYIRSTMLAQTHIDTERGAACSSMHEPM